MKATEEEITQRAIDMLKTVYDPEIPVNVYDLGLIYKIDYEVEAEVLHVDMTLTAPNCPAADFIFEDVRQKLVSIFLSYKPIRIKRNNGSITHGVFIRCESISFF